jgi:hypothetical protein
MKQESISLLMWMSKLLDYGNMFRGETGIHQLAVGDEQAP